MWDMSNETTDMLCISSGDLTTLSMVHEIKQGEYVWRYVSCIYKCDVYYLGLRQLVMSAKCEGTYR
jgi:hypothetical protein